MFNPRESISNLAENPNREERKSEEVRGTYPASQVYDMSMRLYLDFGKDAKNKTQKLRQLYLEVDPRLYEDEDAITTIEDHRVKILDTKIYPFSTHGRLIMIFNEKALYGSGTLIGPRLVLTAAHNLYPRCFQREPDSIIFIPGLNGNECPFGIIRIRRYYFPDEFKVDRSEDFALIELEEDIGETTGFMDIRLHKSEDIEGKECSIFGYPGLINEEVNDCLYGTSGKVSVNENRLEYTVDTSAGQSGSIIYYPLNENKCCSIGVHVKKNLNRGCNSGILLTSQRIERLNEWMISSFIPTKHNLDVLTSEIFGRDKELNKLRDYMKTMKHFRVIGLSGIAGVGKSTIALKFATISIGKYDYIWWINSETEDTFKSSLLELANTLRVEGKRYQEILQKLKVILNCKTKRFLMIFDNIQEGKIAKDLLCTRGHYIITTRLEQI
jgi:V8-like Glu-specific endopeptidase